MTADEFRTALHVAVREARRPIEAMLDRADNFPLEYLQTLFDDRIRLNLRPPLTNWENLACLVSAGNSDLTRAAMIAMAEAASAGEYTPSRLQHFIEQAHAIASDWLRPFAAGPLVGTRCEQALKHADEQLFRRKSQFATQIAAQLHAEAAAARLRPGGRAASANPSLRLRTRRLHATRRKNPVRCGNRRAAAASARGPWPRSLA
jgi:hypothetical protein